MSRCQRGGPKVSLSLCRQPAADCLSVCARFRVCVCVWVGASALFFLSCLFTLQGPGDNGALLDPVTVSPLHPKTRPCASLCAPALYLWRLLSPLLIPNFILALTLFLTAVRDLLQAECGCLLKAGCSLTRLSGPISAPDGLLNCPRFSVRKRARKGQEARGGWGGGSQ